MKDKRDAFDRVRKHFIAMGFPDARNWSDDEIERASAEMGGVISTMGMAFAEVDAALRRFCSALTGREARWRTDTPDWHDNLARVVIDFPEEGEVECRIETDDVFFDGEDEIPIWQCVLDNGERRPFPFTRWRFTDPSSRMP